MEVFSFLFHPFFFKSQDDRWIRLCCLHTTVDQLDIYYIYVDDVLYMYYYHTSVKITITITTTLSRNVTTNVRLS